MWPLRSPYTVCKRFPRYYLIPNLILSPKKGKISGFPFYELSVGSSIGTGRFIDLCIPLLQGHKYYQLALFVKNNKAFQDRVIEFFH